MYFLIQTKTVLLRILDELEKRGLNLVFIPVGDCDMVSIACIAFHALVS